MQGEYEPSGDERGDRPGGHRQGLHRASVVPRAVQRQRPEPPPEASDQTPAAFPRVFPRVGARVRREPRRLFLVRAADAEPPVGERRGGEPGLARGVREGLASALERERPVRRVAPPSRGAGAEGFVARLRGAGDQEALAPRVAAVDERRGVDPPAHEHRAQRRAGVAVPQPNLSARRARDRDGGRRRGVVRRSAPATPPQRGDDLGAGAAQHGYGGLVRVGDAFARGGGAFAFAFAFAFASGGLVRVQKRGGGDDVHAAARGAAQQALVKRARGELHRGDSGALAVVPRERSERGGGRRFGDAAFRVERRRAEKQVMLRALLRAVRGGVERAGGGRIPRACGRGGRARGGDELAAARARLRRGDVRVVANTPEDAGEEFGRGRGALDGAGVAGVAAAVARALAAGLASRLNRERLVHREQRDAHRGGERRRLRVPVERPGVVPGVGIPPRGALGRAQPRRGPAEETADPGGGISARHPDREDGGAGAPRSVTPRAEPRARRRGTTTIVVPGQPMPIDERALVETRER